jgi:Ni,Fe-hydrogenase III small subunit
MIGWLFRGLRSRRLTVGYPRRDESSPPSFRGRAALTKPVRGDQAAELAATCLPGALTVMEDGGLRLDGRRCINCGLCAEVDSGGHVEMESRYELATESADGHARRIPRPFRRSIHIRHVDTGSDGAVEQEVAALLNPYYDMQRLGLFFTATPRHADVLLVTGPVTAPMAEHLRRTYEAMPDPRIVVAAGTDACSGGIWSEPEVLGGVDKVLPVDVYIPGDPPSPITLLHGLLLATGRVKPATAPAITGGGA